jgi:hypothetical protein
MYRRGWFGGVAAARRVMKDCYVSKSFIYQLMHNRVALKEY